MRRIVTQVGDLGPSADGDSQAVVGDDAVGEHLTRLGEELVTVGVVALREVGEHESLRAAVRVATSAAWRAVMCPHCSARSRSRSRRGRLADEQIDARRELVRRRRTHGCPSRTRNDMNRPAARSRRTSVTRAPPTTETEPSRCNSPTAGPDEPELHRGAPARSGARSGSSMRYPHDSTPVLQGAHSATYQASPDAITSGVAIGGARRCRRGRRRSRRAAVARSTPGPVAGKCTVTGCGTRSSEMRCTTPARPRQ